MTQQENAADWAKVATAAERIGRTPSKVYKWLRRPQSETGIRRLDGPRGLLVHVPTLQDYEASINRRGGRPPR